MTKLNNADLRYGPDYPCESASTVFGNGYQSILEGNVSVESVGMEAISHGCDNRDRDWSIDGEGLGMGREWRLTM